MQNLQTIYQQNILPLPDDEKLRLATIILQNLSGNGESKSQTAFDLLQSIQGESVFSTAKEVDEHVQAERESWDN
ncbi:MAG: hypothetical protein ACR2J3_03555 [Aridibacter sp.]